MKSKVFLKSKWAKCPKKKQNKTQNNTNKQSKNSESENLQNKIITCIDK